MKKMKIAAIGAALLLSWGGAQASTYDIGTLGTTPFINGGLVFGTFADKYIFDLTTASAVGGGVTNVPLYLSATHNLNITDLNLAVFNSSNVAVADTDANPTSFTGMLSAGNDYYMQVSGTTTGTLGGLYTLGMIAAPVPEANTWVMLTAGLGLLGWRFARRQGSVKKQGGLVAA